MLGRSQRMRTALLAVSAIALSNSLSLAQAPAAKKVESTYMGAGECAACHSVKDNPQRPNSIGHIKLDEYEIWRKKDKHSVAYTNLLEERGKAMGTRLGMDVTKRETGCLDCHAGNASEDLAVNAKFKTAYKREDGVSCENCHGASLNWIGNHAIAQLWRDKSIADKEALGLNDLRSPVKQAEKCLSCHIGNAAEGKVVTHQMYAVGHPPLPSIEVAAFGEQIPRHWFLEVEKDANKAQKADPNRNLERSKLAVISGVVSLKTALKLLADESKVSVEKVPGLAWPDYARFDCASCHHELERPSWRQERGFASAPGRPPVVRWPLFVSTLAVKQLGEQDASAAKLFEELKSQETTVSDTLRAKPFGKSSDVGASSDKYAVFTDDLIKRLDATKFDVKTVSALLKKLVTEASDTDLDYDAARHVGWTIWSFTEDLKPELKNAAEIDTIMARISNALRLQLPAGRDKKIEDQLADALKMMGEYKPAAFKADLKAIAALLVD